MQGLNLRRRGRSMGGKRTVDINRWAFSLWSHAVSACLCVYVCVACSVNHGDYIRAVFDRNIAENISRVLYPVDNVRIFTVQHMSVSSVQIQLDRFSRLDEHSSPTCDRQTDRQTRVVHGFILYDPIRPYPLADWPNPTQTATSAKIWTQPYPTQYN